MTHRLTEKKGMRVGLRATALVVAAITLLATTGCARSGRFIDPVFDSYEESIGLQYGAAPDENGRTENLLLDLYQPAGDTRDRRPAIVFIHGGGFSGGNRTYERANAQDFARRGYVTVTISYRLRSGNIGQAMVDARHDAQAAVRWLRRHADEYGIDTGRIVAAGTSAGAITALNVGNYPEDPGESGNPGYPSDIAASVSFMGFGGYQSPGDAPAILFHGTADPVVAYEHAVNTCRLAVEQGNVCDLHSYEGAGHDLRPYRDQIIPLMANFLYRHLELSP